MLSFFNLNKKIFTLIFFLIFFLIGIYVFPDYGISIDEDNTRVMGFLSLEYILNVFLPDHASKINEIINTQRSAHAGFETSGVIFDLPMALLELIFKIEDSKQYYLLRHFFNFLLFYVSVYFFFLLIDKRFKSWPLSIIGSLFLIFSPRIFANGFFNNKDLVFMSLFIIGLYAAINLLENKNLRNAIIFSIISAFMINLRIFGLILPIIILLIYIENICWKKNIEKKQITSLIIFLILFPCFTILFAPHLWSDPVSFFSNTIKNLSLHNLDIYSYYLGEFIHTDNSPWHYSFMWILISTPLLYVGLFIIGFIFLVQRTIERWLKTKNNNSFFKMWDGFSELQDIIFLVTFFGPILAAIYFGSISYDGWRHLYFIYPSFLLISILGLNFIKNIFFKKITNYFYIFIVILVIPTAFWMYKNHPFQYVYFNSLAGDNFNEKFEMDYSGISNRHVLEYIIKKENEKVNVHNISTTDLLLAKQILDKDIREKIVIVGDVNTADYLTNNFRDWNGKNKPSNFKIPDNFKIIYEIKIDNISINTIYKKL